MYSADRLEKKAAEPDSELGGSGLFQRVSKLETAWLFFVGMLL